MQDLAARIAELTAKISRLEQRTGSASAQRSNPTRIAEVVTRVQTNPPQYTIKFLNATYPEAGGSLTVEDRTSTGPVASELGETLRSQGDRVIVERINGRWWILGPGLPGGGGLPDGQTCNSTDCREPGDEYCGSCGGTDAGPYAWKVDLGALTCCEGNAGQVYHLLWVSGTSNCLYQSPSFPCGTNDYAYWELEYNPTTAFTRNSRSSKAHLRLMRQNYSPSTLETVIHFTLKEADFCCSCQNRLHIPACGTQACTTPEEVCLVPVGGPTCFTHCQSGSNGPVEVARVNPFTVVSGCAGGRTTVTSLVAYSTGCFDYATLGVIGTPSTCNYLESPDSCDDNDRLALLFDLTTLEWVLVIPLPDSSCHPGGATAYRHAPWRSCVSDSIAECVVRDPGDPELIAAVVPCTGRIAIDNPSPHTGIGVS